MVSSSLCKLEQPGDEALDKGRLNLMLFCNNCSFWREGCKEQQLGQDHHNFDVRKSDSTKAPAQHICFESLQTSRSQEDLLRRRTVKNKRNPSKLTNGSRSMTGNMTRSHRVHHPQQTQEQPSASIGETTNNTTSDTAQSTPCTDSLQMPKTSSAKGDNVHGTKSRYFLNCYYTNADNVMKKRGEFLTNIDLWKRIKSLESQNHGTIVLSRWRDSIEGYVLYRQDKIAL